MFSLVSTSLGGSPIYMGCQEFECPEARSLYIKFVQLDTGKVLRLGNHTPDILERTAIEQERPESDQNQQLLDPVSWGITVMVQHVLHKVILPTKDSLCKTAISNIIDG